MAASPNIDVRMRGFASRVPVEHALAWIDRELDSRLGELPIESIPLSKAANRVLARAVVAETAVPRFTRAMMDGFAVRAADTAGASSYNRLPLVEVGQSLPGSPCANRVGPGEAVRIMTGAPLPDGADAVLPVEFCVIEANSDSGSSRTAAAGIHAVADVAPGKHVGRAGEDVVPGDRVLAPGRILRPQDVGVLSSLGVGQVEVICRPRVQLVITGDELVPAGESPELFRIADANGPMLEALVRRDRGDVRHPGIVPDHRDAIETAMHADADVILVSGGSSCGQEDHAPTILAEHGALAVHGIAIRPSSPTGMGTLGDRMVFLLPGNPVSCLCAYDFFAGRAIRQLGRRTINWPYPPLERPLRRKLVSPIGRLDYARVCIEDEEVVPLATGGASILSNTTRADGFVIVPTDSEGHPPGHVVTVWRYDCDLPPGGSA